MTELGEAALATCHFLNNMADTLDEWAEQSRAGSWSTHQVAANTKAAEDCRRQSAKLLQVIVQNK